MIVTVDVQVFEQHEKQLELLRLIGLCEDDRHHLTVDPPYRLPGDAPALDTWLASLSPQLRHEVIRTLEYGARRMATRPYRTPRIRVANTPQCDWTAPEPILPVPDALRLLQMPLKLLVENRRNDGAFLRKITPRSYKNILKKAVERGWVEIEHGGGIPEMLKRVETALHDPFEYGRLWLMHDSDAHQPQVASERANQLQGLCTNHHRHPWKFQPHQLERRTIENYLPVRSLEEWRDSNEPAARPHYQAITSFAALKNPDQRAHYNMKSGLRGDIAPDKREAYDPTRGPASDSDLPQLFRGLDVQIQRNLWSGFGKNISELFHDGKPWVREEHLEAEIPDRERLEIIQSIIDRI